MQKETTLKKLVVVAQPRGARFCRTGPADLNVKMPNAKMPTKHPKQKNT